MAEEKDDWLEDVEPAAEETSTELDQFNIDALLATAGGTSATPPVRQEEPAAEDDGVLDQSNIDALLAGAIGGTPASSGSGFDLAPEDSLDVDQSDIDALLAGVGDDMNEPVGTPEVNQSDIDALLAGEETTALGGNAFGESSVDADQAEIDRLFSEVDDEVGAEDPFQAEEVDFNEIVGAGKGASKKEDAFGLASDSGFDAEEFGFDEEIPEIPDELGAAFTDQTQGMNAPTQRETTPAASAPEKKEVKKASGPRKPFLPPFLRNRKVLGSGAALLAVLLGVGFYLFHFGHKPSQLAIVLPPPVVQPPTPPPAAVPLEAPPEPAANTAPVAEPSEYQLSAPGKEVAINLAGHDKEGDPLTYEILSKPAHGRLSGKAPAFVYLPTKDFSDKDSFQFRVNDGKTVSEPANVSILAPKPAEVAAVPPPEPAAPAVAPPPVVAQHRSKPVKKSRPRPISCPTPAAIAAANYKTEVSNGKEVVIDMAKIWAKTNRLPFDRQVTVELNDKNLHGSLTDLGAGKYLYRPDKSFRGTETLTYRFSRGEQCSPSHQLQISVLGSRTPPEINLQPLGTAYSPGESVVLDASATRAEDRQGLTFTWQQMAGTPVLLKTLNQEGSMASFVVPSSFSTESNPGPVLQVTVVDRDGNRDSKQVKIPTKSRRQTALWGLNGGSAPGGLRLP